MVVQCPNCQTKFRIADEKVTDKGVRVRCTSCKNVFQVRKSGTEAASSQSQSGTTQELQALQFGPGGELLSRPPPISGKPGPQLSRPPRIPAPPLGQPPQMAPPPIRPPSNPLLQPVQRPSAPPPALSKPPPAQGLPRPALSRPPPALSKPPAAASLPRPPLPTQVARPASSPSLPRPALSPPPGRPSAAPPPRPPPPPGPGLPRPSLPVPPPRTEAITPPPPANSGMPSTASAPGALGRRRPSSVTGLDPVMPPARPSAPPNQPDRGPAPRGRATADDLFGMDELTGDMSAQPGSPLSSNPNLARLKTAPPPPPPESLPPPPPREDPQPPPAEPDNSGAVKLGAVKLAVRDPLAELAESISGSIGVDADRAPAPPDEGAPPPPDPSMLRPVQREMVAVGMTGLIGVAVALAVGAATSFINPPPPWMREGTVQPVIATQIASGLYDVSSTKPVFFIRGRIENHGANTVGAVQVVADLIGTSGSVARVETVAGTEPSAEEIRALKTPEDVDAMAQKLAKAAAGKLLSPGESEPFFALIADPPADAERDELRLNLAVTPLHR